MNNPSSEYSEIKANWENLKTNAQSKEDTVIIKMRDKRIRIEKDLNQFPFLIVGGVTFAIIATILGAIGLLPIIDINFLGIQSINLNQCCGAIAVLYFIFAVILVPFLYKEFQQKVDQLEEEVKTFQRVCMKIQNTKDEDKSQESYEELESELEEKYNNVLEKSDKLKTFIERTKERQQKWGKRKKEK